MLNADIICQIFRHPDVRQNLSMWILPVRGVSLALIDTESALHTGSVDSFPRRFAL